MSRLKSIIIGLIAGAVYSYPLSISAEQVPWFIYIPVWLIGCLSLGVAIGSMSIEINHYKD